MFWSRRRYCGSLCPRLGARIYKWQRRRAAWSDAPPLGQFWQISYGSAEPLCRWQQRCYILLYFTQSPSIHPYFSRSTTIHILGGSNCCVSGDVARAIPVVWCPVLKYSVVPISIVGAHRFYATITNFLGMIGYWTSMYTAIILVEHLYFRKNDSSLYDMTAWNVPKHLPSGIAAGAASVLSFGVVIPCINQVWFTGAIARTTGDIGFEVSFAVSGMLYFLFRWIEIRWRGVL